MRPDLFQLIGYGSLALLVVYAVFLIRRRRLAPKAPASFNSPGDAHLEALRENSDLLRELIAINRKLLERQERHDA